MGTALNKILKDVVTRSQQMLGFDSNYVPGWDCHGLPIEWRVEEEYRAKGKDKDAVPIIEFRRECRQFAQHWIEVQRDEFMRLGGVGDWENYYSTMNYGAEAQIARELMKFAANGLLYRGSKPVMWSVVEKTALAEAEVEYEDYVSDQVWVKFPVQIAALGPRLDRRVDDDAVDPSRQPRHQLFTEDRLWPLQSDRRTGGQLDQPRRLVRPCRQAGAGRHATSACPGLHTSRPVKTDELTELVCDHPLKGFGGSYGFQVPLLAGDHVTDDTGTGFVHTAPGHGREDFDIWTTNAAKLAARGINTTIPYTVDENGAFTTQAPGFTGKRVLTDTGDKGDANETVIAALRDAGTLIARSRLTHEYPHSWRSKKPVIFRNTPQWFIAMDKDIAGQGDTLRARAVAGIKATRWVPPQGENRITGMVLSKPDWVLSRQRAWGVPLPFFVREKGDGSVDVLKDAAVDRRITDTFEKEGADAWYAQGAATRFLGSGYDPAEWRKVDDIVDVWFEFGCTYTFTLEVRDDLKVSRKKDGGPDTVVYLEGSDQHRGWFQSSLMESCATRGVAPFDIVVTHGFFLDEHGRKMSKSLGNVLAPEDVIKDSGADILRMWACASDYTDDLRIGPEILKTTVESYRKLRNSIRWMLGNLAHFRAEDRVDPAHMAELERLMLHRLAELDPLVRQAYADFDYKRIFAALNAFMNVDLSAFYFDVRKDALYCDPISSTTRKACLTVLDHLFRCTVTWLAPMLCFTAEEAWLSRFGPDVVSVHLELFPEVPKSWRDDRLAEKWRKIRMVRRVVTGALEIERAQKRIGSSLEAAPVIYINDADLFASLVDVDMAEIAITSAATIVEGEGPEHAFRLPDVPGVAVEPRPAAGRKCARSWKILPNVGADPDFPDVTPRDARALREWEATRKAAE